MSPTDNPSKGASHNYVTDPMTDHHSRSYAPENDVELRLALLEQQYMYQKHRAPEGTNNGKLYLDSAADPTHLSQPTSTMHPLTSTVLTQTANGDEQEITNVGQETIKTLRVQLSLGQEVSTPAIQKDLASVHNLACHYGQVAFQSSHAYVLDTRNRLPIVRATATYRDGLYELNRNIHDGLIAIREQKTPLYHQALSSRTIPYAKISPNPLDHKEQAHLPLVHKQATSSSPSQYITIHSLPTSNQIAKIDLTRMTPRPERIPAKTKVYSDWHLKLARIQPKTIHLMAKSILLPGLPSELSQPPLTLTCSGCSNGKLKKAPHRPTQHITEIFSHISSDVCGPITPISKQGNKHLITFVYKRTRYSILHCVPTRDKVAHLTTATLEHIRNLHGNYPNQFMSDSAQEYKSHHMLKYYRERGIICHPMVPYSPQENSLAKRIYHTIYSKARATLATAGLDKAHWEDAVRDAVF